MAAIPSKPRVRVPAATRPLAQASSSIAPAPSGYEGAMASRRLAAWRPTGSHVNALLQYHGDELVRRSRELARNNPYVRKARGTFVANAVGTGIKPSSLTGDAARKKAIQEAWLDWTDEADADGLTDFYGMQALAAGAMFEAGECFVRFRPRRAGDGLSVPLQLQLLEAEQLPLTKTELAANGNVIRAGIEFDRIGRRVAYHFHRVHPGDATLLQGYGEFTRVPASEVCHLYQPMRPGQIRGEPWLTAALVKARQLDEYDDAELDRKKVAALFAGFLTMQGAEDPATRLGGTDQGDGSAIAGLQPGTLIPLRPGEGVEFSEPADVGGNYEAFQYRTLLAVSAAMGIPYADLTGDLRQVNYSSIRAGLIAFRRALEQMQHAVLVFQMCRPVWRRWMDAAVLAGALDLPGFAQAPRPWYRVKWIAPKWEWVDPLKDRQAEKLAVDAGFKARSDVIEAEGYDPEEVDARIAADQERERALGLSFAASAVKPDEGFPSDDEPRKKQDAGTDKAASALDDYERRMAGLAARAAARARS